MSGSRTRSLGLAWIAGLLLACGGAAEAPPKPATLAPEALQATLAAGEPVLVLDVRSRDEFEQGRVPGAVHVPHTEVAERLPELQDRLDEPVVVYCERGGRARVAMTALQEAGVEDVRHLEGDMRGWLRAGRPVER